MDVILQNFEYIRYNDVVDIAIITFLIYQLLKFIRETRTKTLIQGLIIVFFVLKFSEIFQLHTLQFIIKNMMTLGLIALIIVFQPELRRALEIIGRNKFSSSFSSSNEDESESTILEIVLAVTTMSKTQTGALIVIERETPVSDLIGFGVKIDAVVNSMLIRNIFFKNSPLHDGAMIIKNNRIKSASCILPLTQTSLSKELGTRHRAALGIVEKSDAFVIVVSEENGGISVCFDNNISRFLNEDKLKELLVSQIGSKEKSTFFSPNMSMSFFWKGK